MKKFTQYRNLVVCIWMILAGSASIVRSQDNGTIIPLPGLNVEEFRCASFSKDGSKIVTVSQAPLKIWNAKTGDLIIEFDSAVSGGYTYAEFSPDDTRIVVTGHYVERSVPGEFDYFIQIYDAETGAEIRRIGGHPTIVRKAHYLNGGDDIISIGDDNLFYIWGAESGELKRIIPIPDFAYEFSISPDEKYIAAIRMFGNVQTSRLNSSIRIMDLATGDSLKEIVFADSTALDVKWANNSEELLVCMYKNLEGFMREFIPLRIINAWTEEILNIYDYPGVYAGVVEISSKNMIAVSSGEPGLILEDVVPQMDIWMRTSTGPLVAHQPLSLAWYLTFSPDGEQLAFLRRYGDTAYIWNLPAISDAPVAGNVDHGMAISCTPNPASSELIVNYQVSSPSVIRMSLVDAIGRTVSVLVDKAVEAGVHRLPLKVDDLQPGIYYCYAQKGGQVSVCPIHVVR